MLDIALMLPNEYQRTLFWEVCHLDHHMLKGQKSVNTYAKTSWHVIEVFCLSNICSIFFLSIIPFWSNSKILLCKVKAIAIHGIVAVFVKMHKIKPFKSSINHTSEDLKKTKLKNCQMHKPSILFPELSQISSTWQ